MQGVIDEVPVLLADFAGPLSSHTNREKLAQFIAARAAAAGQEVWCSQPDVLKVCTFLWPPLRGNTGKFRAAVPQRYMLLPLIVSPENKPDQRIINSIMSVGDRDALLTPLGSWATIQSARQHESSTAYACDDSQQDKSHLTATRMAAWLRMDLEVVRRSAWHAQALWAVLGLLVRHQGRLKSAAAPSKKDDASPEAQLAAVLVRQHARPVPLSRRVNSCKSIERDVPMAALAVRLPHIRSTVSSEVEAIDES